jgi:hypothetical protein
MRDFQATTRWCRLNRDRHSGMPSSEDLRSPCREWGAVSLEGAPFVSVSLPPLNMDRSKPQKTVKPVKTLRLHGVAVSVFRNPSEDGESVFYKSTLQRVYKQGDEWKTTQSLSRDDLPIAALLLEQAWEFILQAESSASADDQEE